MTFTLTFGWWIAPALVSLTGFILSFLMNREGMSVSGGIGGAIGAMFGVITYLIFFVIPSLPAWLIWALLK